VKIELQKQEPMSVNSIHNVVKYSTINVQEPIQSSAPNLVFKKKSILLLIIPVGSPRLDFARGLKLPPKHQFHPL
jgi:hypothetical protein